MAYKESDMDLFQDVEDQDQDQEEMEDEQPPESEPLAPMDEYQDDGSDQDDEEQYEDAEDPKSQQDQSPDQEQLGIEGGQAELSADQSVDPSADPVADSGSQVHLLAGTYKSKYPIHIDEEIKNASGYSLTPTTAFIQGCPTFSMALSWGTKFLFTGGEDGYIRQYSFSESISGTQPLTIGQRPSFVDTILNGGVLKGYWENEEPLFEQDYKFDAQGTYAPTLSPVYSLAAHSEGIWVAAGLKSGGINIQTVRHSAGIIQAHLDLHTNVVSELQLSSDERNLLSGSWDKTAAYWDLETGTPIRHYSGLNGQVSTIAWQPLGGPLCASSDDNKSIDSLFGDEEDDIKKENEKNNPEAKPEATSDGADHSQEKVNTGNSFMTSTFNGAVEVWDIRTTERELHLGGSSAPPWCMSTCWSPSGTNIYAGRRNNTVDEYDVRMSSQPSRTFKFPSSSGPVTGVVCMPNGRQLMCSSNDNLRLYDLNSENKKTPFHIVPSHHGAAMSRLLLDPSGRYLLTSSGSRGWNDGPVSDMVLCYEVAQESL